MVLKVPHDFSCCDSVIPFIILKKLTANHAFHEKEFSPSSLSHDAVRLQRFLVEAVLGHISEELLSP